MTFQTVPTSVPSSGDKQRLGEAAEKLAFSPEYKLLLETLQARAMIMLYRHLADGSRSDNFEQGRLKGYVEMYGLLTNGKDLFHAGP